MQVDVAPDASDRKFRVRFGPWWTCWLACIVAMSCGSTPAIKAMPAVPGSSSRLSLPQGDRTEASYRQRIEKDPQDVEALEGLARLAADRDHCNQSIDYARRALAIAPENADFELTLARSLVLCQQYSEAIARYQHVVNAKPQGHVITELGAALLRGHRNDEAVATFREALEIDPKDAAAAFGLAQALAFTGNYAEALRRYDDALRLSPDDYDALQGKAYVLYWTHQFDQSRSLFEQLHQKNPQDPENAEAIANIVRAQEEARLARSTPAPGAPPQDWAAFYQKRIALNPEDTDALKALASAEVQLKNFPAAIESYMKIVGVTPNDREAKTGLAHVLGWSRRYDESIHIYRDLLKAAPDDADLLAELARVYSWSNRVPDALQVYEHLLARNPSNTDVQLEIARLQLRTKDYPAARVTLTSVLSTHPDSHDARVELARLEMGQNQYDRALKQFDELLQQNPRDAEALFGKAQASYYRGDVGGAHAITSRLVSEHPDNYDAVFLLANIEHAQGKRREALDLLKKAQQLSPKNPEVTSMREKLESEAPVTMTTTASYAREIIRPGLGVPASEGSDLRAFAYGTKLSANVLPRSDSSFWLSYLPSSFPSGFFGGAVAPAQFLYQQTTRLPRVVTLRGGVGLVHFGPGDLVNLPKGAGAQPSATTSAVGYAGGSIEPMRSASLDLTWSRSAMVYTPLAVRLGVIENRYEGGVNLHFGPMTEAHLTYYQVRYTSEAYDHLILPLNPVPGEPGFMVNKSDHIKGSGGTFTFRQKLIHADRVSFDAGYSAQVYGYDGPKRGVFLGFFTPSFYQLHLLDTWVHAKLWRSLGYDFSGGVGLQQVDQGQALTRALILTPAFTWRVNPRLSFTLGYTHYDMAQALGVVRGNGVRLSTDWKF